MLLPPDPGADCVLACTSLSCCSTAASWTPASDRMPDGGFAVSRRTVSHAGVAAATTLVASLATVLPSSSNPVVEPGDPEVGVACHVRSSTAAFAFLTSAFDFRAHVSRRSTMHTQHTSFWGDSRPFGWSQPPRHCSPCSTQQSWPPTRRHRTAGSTVLAGSNQLVAARRATCSNRGRRLDAAELQGPPSRGNRETPRSRSSSVQASMGVTAGEAA